MEGITGISNFGGSMSPGIKNMKDVLKIKLIHQTIFGSKECLNFLKALFN